MKRYFQELPEAEMMSMQAILDAYKNENYKFSFLSFNYTDVLDRIVDLYGTSKIISNRNANASDYIGNILHIHGTINEGILLGVNDESQVLNEEFVKNSLFLDTFIKERINKAIGNNRTPKALDYITQSRIICVYGMSIGDTDKMWWEHIVKWLLKSTYNKLLIYWYTEEEMFNKKAVSKIICVLPTEVALTPVKCH